MVSLTKILQATKPSQKIVLAHKVVDGTMLIYAIARDVFGMMKKTQEAFFTCIAAAVVKIYRRITN